jgi:hypothetical protein
MDSVKVEYVEKPKLRQPILIEGLPGVGNIGYLAAEHLIDQLKAKKLAKIYSKHLPSQVIVERGGIVRLVSNELYYAKAPNNDLIILLGDAQASSPEGQYEMVDKFLDIAQELGVGMIYTLGGYALNRMVDEPRVIGAGTSDRVVKEAKEHGVIFVEGEPGGGIWGASGLLLGLGKARGIEGLCLMGETSGYGYLVNPKSAEKVLRILTSFIDVELDYSELEKKAEEVEEFASKIADMADFSTEASKEDLRYIG